MSLSGISLGVAALIVIISVMNGFENELRERFLGATSHGSVFASDGDLADWREIRQQAIASPQIDAAAPYVRIESMLVNGRTLSPARILGIVPEYETTVSKIDDAMLAGRLDDLTDGAWRIVLGLQLARRLGVVDGDDIIVMVPKSGTDDAIPIPEQWRFTISGVFEVGIEEHDGVLALVHMADAARMAGIEPGHAGGVRLQTQNIFRAADVAAALAAEVGPGYESTDWTKENASYFRAVAIEKTMMTVLMFLIVAVAAFNIVATLVMVVTDKRSEIAILRTIGSSPASIVSMFMTQGIVIGLTGTLLGVGIGIALALNVDTVAPWLESTFGFKIFDPGVYYISEIPSDLRAGNVVATASIAFLLTFVSTLYPSFRAAKTPPAEALRYD